MQSKRANGVIPNISSGTTLRRYRLAAAATAEYTQTYGGGSVSGALSAITTTVNLADAIYERDVAIRLTLIANDDTIIFTDTTTDGYTTDNVSALISENQTKLDSVIGSVNYDIGHVFDGRLLSGGAFSWQGLAGIGVVCVNGVKARGVDIFRSVSPNSVIAYYSAAHEMGHQFGATHTFNTTSGSCGSQRAPATAYEPYNGSTIMAYRLACAPDDLMSTDTYFHNASIEQIVNFTNGGSGNSCATATGTGNTPPSVSAGASYTIPMGTPFILTASGSDADGDAITYDWEEFDLGTAAPPNTDDGTRPIFRSFAPTTSPARMFPRLQDVLTGSATMGELLPSTTRTMNFRVTARDNRSGGGGINSAATQVNVRNDAGPFTVTSPTSSSSWPVGSTQTVTWNVANTSGAPINAATVRITLSVNGVSFPYILANNTPNDGSELVTLPFTPTSSARIKVEAAGNIFFNISQGFTITGSAQPGIQFSSSAYSVNEGAGVVEIYVHRSDTVSSAAVNYATSDTAGLQNCTVVNGKASERCDYVTSVGTLNYAAGEGTKVFTVPLIDDAWVEGNETFSVSLSSPTGNPIGGLTAATVTIVDNDSTQGTTNPIDGVEFFIRQQYADFLNRQPDATGLQNWINTLAPCPNGGFGEPPASDCDRLHVAAGFFQSDEFLNRGYWAFRLYMVSFQQRPTYAQFIPDMAQVGGPKSPAEEESSKAAFAEAFVQRPEFTARYSGQHGQTLANALTTNSGLPAYTVQAGETDGQILRHIAERQTSLDKFLTEGTVSILYFGFQRRDPDTIGYQNNLDTLNANPNNLRHMIFIFIYSTEYRQRFGPS